MDTPRKVAALGIVQLHRGGYAHLIAKTALANPALDARGRAFAGALFYGTAERIVTLDRLLAPHLKRPVEKLDTEVRAVLESGLYQIRYMNVPARAAVDESVKLTRQLGKSSAAGLVNAVLRRAAESRPEQLLFHSEADRIGVLYSVGPAVAAALMEALPDEYEPFLAASFSRGGVCLRVNTLRTSCEALERALLAQGAQVRRGALPDCLYAKLPTSVESDPLFRQGLYHVQGEASQYACAQLDARPGMTVLDMCAAPGGKSATLAQHMQGSGHLIACEKRENRLPLLRETFRRLGIQSAAVRQNDAASQSPLPAGAPLADRILCDVPCSGLGVLADKPDLRYTSGENFASLPALQAAILAGSAACLRPGGRLVYSTCTVRPQENARVVTAFLAQHPGYALLPPASPPPGALVEENMVTILPHRTGMSGFFVATLARLC